MMILRIIKGERLSASARLLVQAPIDKCERPVQIYVNHVLEMYKKWTCLTSCEF